MLCTKCGQEYEGSQCPRCDGPVILVNNSDYLARRKAYEATEWISFENKYMRHDIGKAIDAYIRPFGYGIVRDLCGHGIGRHMHEEPEIPNYRVAKRGMKLKAGMTLAIEPMINAGTYAVKWKPDGWTVVTKDGSLSAHYENTVLVTEDGPEILSLVEE